LITAAPSVSAYCHHAAKADDLEPFGGCGAGANKISHRCMGSVARTFMLHPRPDRAHHPASEDHDLDKQSMRSGDGINEGRSSCNFAVSFSVVELPREF